MKKPNRLIALLLTVGMLFTMVNIPVIAADGGNMKIEMVVFRYPTDNPPTTLKELEAHRVKLEDGETLAKGEDIVVGVKYTGLQNITDYGYKVISSEIQYPYEYFEPQYLTDTILGMLELNPEFDSFAIDDGNSVPLQFSNQFLPELYSQKLYTRSYANDVFVETTENGEVIRGTYFYRNAVNDNYVTSRDFAITDDSGYFDFFRYNVKKATEGDTKVEFRFNTTSSNNENDSRIVFGLSTYAADTDGTAVPSTKYETPKAFTDAGHELITPLKVDIDDLSAKPVVENGKTYDADGDLEATSTLTVNALEDAGSSSGEKPIPANTVIKLYEATATVADGVVTLTKNGAAVDEITVANDGGSAVFDLDKVGATATTDYIITATEDGIGESEGVSIAAATAVLDFPDDNIVTKYNYTLSADGPKYSDESHVRVFEIGGETVNEYSQINLYDSNDESAVAIDTFGDDPDELLTEGFIKVGLAGLDSSVTYYVTAEQDDRSESPVKYEIKKQSYAPNGNTVEFKNNAAKGTDHVLTVKHLLSTDGTNVEIKQGTKIKVYADANGQTLLAEATAAADGSAEVTFSADASGIYADTEKMIWISAIEPGGIYLESSLVPFTTTTAYNKIIGIIDPDTGAVIGDPDAEVPTEAIEAVNNRTDLVPIGDTVKIPAGTNETDFADYGLTAGKVAVLLENPVSVNGESTRVIFVDITGWTVNEDLSSIVVDADRNAKLDSADAESQTYTDGVYTTLDFTAYADESLVEPEGGLKVVNNIEVTKASVIIEPVDPGELETGEHTVPNPVVVPEGTTKEELAKFGLTGNQIAVKFSPAKVNEDGTTTDIAYVDIEWNYDTDLTFPLELDENGTEPTEYILTGSFTADSLAAAGVVASDIKYSPETTIQVTAKPVATGVVDENNKIYPTPSSPEADEPTQEVIDDIEAKITNGEATPYKSVIYVKAGTTKTDALAMLKADLKIPVIVYTNSAADGLTQSVEYVEVNWNTANVFDGASDPLIEAGKEYSVTGTLAANENITFVPAIQQLTTIFKVVSDIEISLNKGNALPEDITRGYNESDIFVYYNHVFTDPLVSVKSAAHTYTAAEIADLPEGTLTRTLSVIDSDGNEVPGSQVALPAYAENEALNQFALVAKSDYSKHYRITYTFTDLDGKSVGTAKRDVYAIYKRGDFDIDGVVGALDLSAIKDHQAKVKELVLSDTLYKSKTANASKSPDDKVGPASLSAMKDHQGKVTTITDDYATKEDGEKVYMVFSSSAE